MGEIEMSKRCRADLDGVAAAEGGGVGLDGAVEELEMAFAAAGAFVSSGIGNGDGAELERPGIHGEHG
jgi:hypothetical protein